MAGAAPLQNSSNSNEIVTGSCHCGGVQFQFIKPVAQLLICHGIDCRKTTGVTVNDFIGVSRSKFTMLKDTTLKEYQSSNWATRRFCGNCGCSVGITYHSEKHTVWLFRGMCDSDPGPGLHPGCHLFTGEGSKAPWDILTDDGYDCCAKAELYQADCGKEVAQ